ncbi:mitochondrial carrier protein [Guillardia theta CCMP2712]|uniref:Mitochondrial carrier protein n=2 Tax=Guillardia theta TaxID=55529 RepID=L1J7J3_GUITC|nr:mitochondrial carrier protein [Guillardia theta CCMP2712]EKX44055.1 mitochondrial carrier protein [Guillardia theta CCMP2712]|mmetsp:Transcript_15566/g.52161  ORF Transcript_15566/g.52161 Transcript_15566/m.52161 type:complete len:356 (+) Transcript_15566:74-1141(+)|eukprot:XP_005831035.1 mitochondrial carrier protein [Guillardia theta CCMP2712]
MTILRRQSGTRHDGTQAANDAIKSDEDEEDEAEIEDLLYSIIARKEISVAWKDTSLPHLLGYGSALYIVEQLLMYPSDLLKTRLQVDLRPTNKLWKDWIVLCRHIYGREGMYGFFRGFGFNTFAGIPAQLAYLVTYNWCKEKVEGLGGEKWKESPIAPLCAGALAEGLTSCFWVPLDVIVQKIQIQGGLPPSWEKGSGPAHRPVGSQFKGALSVVKDVIKEDGVFGLWRGTGAHILAFVPQAAVWWASYEQSKQMLARRAPDAVQGMPIHLTAGMIAGAVNAIVTNPLDTMKVRVQTKIGTGTSGWNTITQMVKSEGVSSLGKGLAPKLWMAVPVSALSSVCYELIMSLSKVKSK